MAKSTKKMTKKSKTKRFLNRELGMIRFNERILHQAKDHRLPLLERVQFLNIFHSNNAEFFMKRVGGLERQMKASLSNYSQDGLTAEEQLIKINQEVRKLDKEVAKFLKTDLLPELKSENIHLMTWKNLTPAEKRQANSFFKQNVFPVLTPMAVDQGHPFPLISSMSFSLAVSLKQPKDSEKLFARIKVPENLPLWKKLKTKDPNEHKFVSLIEIIINNLKSLFPHMRILNVMTFRLTRNINIETQDEEAEDLLEMISEELKQRKFAEIVRLEHGPKPNPWLLNFLIDELELEDHNIYASDTPLEFKSLDTIPSINKPNLRYKAWSPIVPHSLQDDDVSIFNSLRKQSLLVHHPYESFGASVERFLEEATNDPNVVAIKMTLYRTSDKRSNIIDNLLKAAELGKQVVCVIELQARLDEAKNIYRAQELENAGVHVVYGMAGIKTHCKLLLVARKEQGQFRLYSHVGTGNYNSETAKLYTDLGLITSNRDICMDVAEIFHFLTGRSLKSNYRKLLVAPVNLKDQMIEFILREAHNAKKGQPAEIVAKVNGLQDPDVIEALYEASQAGVEVHLIVRGFSCLRPKVKGLSENIRVYSIIGRFLEHSRVFYFRNAAQDPLDGEFYMGSADWMFRNLARRVEVVTPVEEPTHRRQLWSFLQALIKDQWLVWDMSADGKYRQRRPRRSSPPNVHELLMQESVRSVQSTYEKRSGTIKKTTIKKPQKKK